MKKYVYLTIRNAKNEIIDTEVTVSKDWWESYQKKQKIKATRKKKLKIINSL